MSLTFLFLSSFLLTIFLYRHFAHFFNYYLSLSDVSSFLISYLQDCGRNKQAVFRSRGQSLWNTRKLFMTVFCACLCVREMESTCVRITTEKVFSHNFLPHQESTTFKDSVSVCFLVCSSFLAGSWCQTIQGSSHCLPMHPDPTANRSLSSFCQLYLRPLSTNILF